MENTNVDEHISPNCNNPTSETVNGQDDNEQQVDCKIQPSDDHSNTSPLSNSSRNQDNQESNQTELSTYDEAPEEPQLSCTMGPRLLEDTTNPNLLVLSGYQEELPLDADVDVGEDPISTNWEQHRRHVVASRRYVAEYNTDGGVRVEEFDEVEEDHEDSIEEYSGEEEYDYAPAAHPKAQNPVSIAVLLVGNLATVVVLGLLYLNYVLFKSYFFVLLYSFLISEALWDTKMTLVRFIRKLNDVNQMSPRERLHRLWHIPVQDLLCHRGSEPPRWNWKKVVLAVGIISTVLFFMLVAPFVVLLGCAFLVCFVSVLLVFDTHVMKAFRVHRWFMTDDSLVALVVISVLLSVGVFFASSFVLLSIRDAMTAVEVVSVSVSKILDDDATQDLWKHATMTGTQALKSMVENFEGQYRDTAWGPIIDRISEALRHVEENTNPQQKSIWTVLQVNDVLGPIEWDGTLQGGWLALQAATQNIIPDWEGNQTIIDLAQAVFADPSQFINENILQVTGKLDGVITGAYVAILNSGAVLFSLVVSLFDFGVRMAFLLTLVFMLLSSKENVLHAFLKEFVDHDESNPAPNGRGQNTVLSPQIPQYVPSTINPQDLNIAAPTAATATGLHGSQESGNQQTLQSAKQSDPSRTLSGDSIDSLNGSQYGDTFTHSSADHIPPSENVMVDDDSDRYSQPKRLSPILQFEHKLRRTIEGVFMLPFKMALAHACCTFSLFYVFNADFMFFASSLSVFFTLFPVLYPQWISIPWCLIYMYRGYFGSSLTLQVLHYLALSYVDDYLLANFQMKRMKGHGMITVSKPVVHPPSRERRSSSSSISSTQSSGSSNGGGGQVNEVVERSTSDKSPKKYMRRLVSEPIVYSTSALNNQRHHRVLHRNSGGSTSPLQTQFSSKSKEEEISRKRNSKTNYLTGLSLFFGVNAFGAQGVLLGPLLVCLAIVVYETFIGHFKRQQMQQNLFHQMQQQQQLRANQVSSNPGSSPYAPMYASTAAGSPRPMEAATGAPLGSHSHNQLRFPVNSKRSVSEPILSGIQSSESKRQLDGGLESFAAAVDPDDSTDGEGVHATEASGGQQQWRQRPFVQPNIARNHIRQTIVKSPVALPDCSSQSSAPNSPRSGDHGYVDKASSSYDRDRSGSSPRNSKTLRNDVSRQYPSNRMTRRKSTPSIVSEKPNFKRIILNAFVEPFLNSGGNEKQEKRHHSPRARSNYYHKSRRIKRHSTESRALSTRGPRSSIFDDEGMDGLQESDYASRFQNQGLRQRRPHTTRASQSVQRKPFSAAD